MLYVLGRDPRGASGRCCASCPTASGLSLDAMRRGPGRTERADRGAGGARARARPGAGAHEVSLNFAGFGHIMAEGRELNAPQRLARLALGVAHSRFQLERLWAFNQKFEPQWRPRYLVYESRTQLPRAGAAGAAGRGLPAPAAVPGARPRAGRLPVPWWAREGARGPAAGRHRAAGRWLLRRLRLPARLRPVPGLPAALRAGVDPPRPAGAGGLLLAGRWASGAPTWSTCRRATRAAWRPDGASPCSTSCTPRWARRATTCRPAIWTCGWTSSCTGAPSVPSSP